LENLKNSRKIYHVKTKHEFSISVSNSTTTNFSSKINILLKNTPIWTPKTRKYGVILLYKLYKEVVINHKNKNVFVKMNE
jgi:hypothetical protein